MLDCDSPAKNTINNSSGCSDFMLMATDSFAQELMDTDKADKQKNADQQKKYDQEVKDYFETPVGFKTRARDIEISKTDQKPNDQHGAIKKGSID
jgi:hypothetical protein